MASDVKKYLHKVLQSSEFQNSLKYQKLLEYLVQSTLEGNIPKEVTIAMDLFGAEMNDDILGESNIRVYVHNVRKKLDSYYNNEGKNDPIQFRIPKGRYKVEFERRTSFRQYLRAKPVSAIGFVVVLLLIADLLIIRFLVVPRVGAGQSDFSSPIWADILTREPPLLVIVGDYYLIEDASLPDRSRYLRDVRINSEDDLDKFLTDYPELEEALNRTKHTFMGKYAPICIEKLGKLLTQNKTDFRVILSSEFHWQDLKNFNVIYIGSFKSMGILGNLLKNSNFRFDLYPNKIYFHELETDSIYQYYPFDSDINDAFETDYCVVTKLPGSEGRSVFMFISVRDIGLIGTMDYFTSPETQRMFHQQLEAQQKDAEYFEACFKIEGLDRHSISIDLVNLNPLSHTTLFDLSGNIEAETR